MEMRLRNGPSMMRFEIMGTVAPLHNAREFHWLLSSVKPPVTQVVFEPRPDEHGLHGNYEIDISKLLTETLQVDYSPWNYPVFVIAHEHGFASIHGARDSGQEDMVALALFSSEEKKSSRKYAKKKAKKAKKKAAKKVAKKPAKKAA